MRDAMGIIYTGDSNVNLQELTVHRSIAALPFAGRYRVVDFTLSNMINSGVINVGIITQNNYHSLMDHLDSGKMWDLDRKNGGLFILPPYVSNENTGWYRGEIEAFHSNMSYIRRSSQKYVVISGSNMVCSLTFQDALDFHKENAADITVIYKKDEGELAKEFSKHTLIKTDDNNRIWDIEVEPTSPESDKVSMEMYIIEKRVFEHLVEESFARGKYDFKKDILIQNLSRLKIMGFEYNGYLAKIDSIHSYFKNNMELLEFNNFQDLFEKSGPVYTKVKDEVPARYGKNSTAINSLVADGCIIDGTVENCIIFRGVKIGKGSHVKNSIIMQDTEIYDKVELEHVILDKNVIIRNGKRLIGQDNFPVVIRKYSVV